MPDFNSLKTTNPSWWSFIRGTIPAWNLASLTNVWNTLMDYLTASLATVTPYSPVGVGVIVTPLSSPWTYTAGGAVERVYISGGSVTSIKQYTVNLTLSATCMVLLAPLESVVITYTDPPYVVVVK